MEKVVGSVLESSAIAAKSDYCYSIDIAGSSSTIVILLLLWTTIAIIL